MPTSISEIFNYTDLNVNLRSVKSTRLIIQSQGNNVGDTGQIIKDLIQKYKPQPESGFYTKTLPIFFKKAV
jgi:hypothetical protein